MDTIKWATLSAEQKKARVYSECEARLKAVINKLEDKLKDPNISEKQYQQIEIILLHKKEALKEGRVF